LAVDSVTTKSDTAVDRTLIIYYDRSVVMRQSMSWA